MNREVEKVITLAVHYKDSYNKLDTWNGEVDLYRLIQISTEELANFALPQVFPTFETVPLVNASEKRRVGNQYCRSVSAAIELLRMKESYFYIEKERQSGRMLKLPPNSVATPLR